VYRPEPAGLDRQRLVATRGGVADNAGWEIRTAARWGPGMYEHRREQLLPFPVFLRRVARHLAVSLGLLLGSLALGMLGYVHYEHLGWTDGFLNAAMLLGGMGPVAPLQSEGGKIFAGLYALYSGLVFLVAVGILLAPVAHRLMHRFHIAEEEVT
jgi:hypothetical protein